MNVSKFESFRLVSLCSFHYIVSAKVSRYEKSGSGKRRVLGGSLGKELQARGGSEG